MRGPLNRGHLQFPMISSLSRLPSILIYVLRRQLHREGFAVGRVEHKPGQGRVYLLTATCEYVCKCMHACMHACMYMHTCIHAYMHTCINTNTNTNTMRCNIIQYNTIQYDTIYTDRQASASACPCRTRRWPAAASA